jgi:hypothetical protein
MPDIGDLRNGDKSIKVAVYAALTYDIIAATNSSPQTSEINAAKRADTLMKWVWIGLIQSAAFGVLGAVLDDDTWPPLLGSSLAAIAMYVQYRYAIKSGLENGGASTETY